MFLDALTDQERDALEAIGEVRRFSEGSILIEEDVLGTSFFLILEGDVEVRKKLKLGQHKKLVELGPQEVVGEMGFLGVGSRSASVVAVSDCEVLEFNREKFNAFIAEHPDIGQKIYQSMAMELAERLRQSDEELMNALVWALEKVRSEPTDTTISVPERQHKLKLAIPKPQPLKPVKPPEDDGTVIF